MGGGGLRGALLSSGALLLLACLAPTGLAHDFSEKRYSTSDGLPSDFVKAAAKDRFGFLWLATDAGLVRYDGTDFSTYEEDLSFPFAKGLLLTREGRLLAVGDAGLAEIAGTPGDVRVRELFPASPAPRPRALVAPKGLYQDRQGRVWVSEPRGIVRVDGARLVRYELAPSTHSASFLRSYCLAEDGFGTLWAAAQTGDLLRLDVAADRFVPVEIRWPVTVLNQLRAVAEDRLWAATALGLYEIRVSDGGSVRDVVHFADTSEVSYVGLVGEGVVLGTYGFEAHVGSLEEGRFEPWEQVHAFLVQHILEDEDASLWLSTDEGVVHLRPVPFDRLHMDERGPGRELVSYVQTEDGALYACDRSTVYRLRVHGSGVAVEPILVETARFLLALRTDGRLVWASHEAGMLEIDGRRLVRRIALEGSYAPDLEKGDDSELWLIRANDDGVTRISPDGSRRDYGVDAGVPVRALALDRSPDGELFVATNDPAALLVRYDPARDAFVKVPVDLPFALGDAFNVYDLALDRRGRFWIPSTAGLLEVAEGIARPVRVGATGAAPPAHAVAVADDGLVWFATGLGVVRLDPQTGQHDLFDEEAGLPSKTVGVRDLFAGHGGGLTAVTARGVATLVAPPGPRRELPPPVLLEARVGDRPVEAGAGELKVPHGGYLTARFASPHYGDTLSYQARLEGRDETWRAPQGRHDFLLAGLDGGTHTLQVRAVVAGSDRASAPTGLSFTVARPWYWAWWALVLGSAALAAVAWAASALRSWRSVRTEQLLRALVDERTRELSEANRLLGERNAEMGRFIYTVSHDLKGPLTTIRGFAGLAQRELERDRQERVSAHLAHIATAADKMKPAPRRTAGALAHRPLDPHAGTPCRLAEVAREAVADIAVQLAERGVSRRSMSGLPVVMGDRLRLRQVLREPDRERREVPRRPGSAPHRDRCPARGRAGSSASSGTTASASTPQTTAASSPSSRS